MTGELASPHLTGDDARDLAREVALGQVAFALLIALCVALHPGFVLKANEGGMSNYGVHAKTFLPYTVALLIPIVITVRVSRRATPNSPTARRFVALLRLYSALLFLILITTFPYTLDQGFKILHVVAGALIIIFESVASVWMYRAIRSRFFVLIVQLAGLVLATLTLLGALHVLFLSQLVTGVPFAVLLVRATRVLLSHSASRP